MIRFLKSSAFKMFAIIAAALVAGSVFAVASRSGSSPLTSVISVVFGPLSRLSSYVAAEFSDIPISFKSSSVLLKENEELQKKIDSLTDQLVDYEQLRHKNEFYQQFLEIKEEHSDYTFAEAAIIGRDAADNMGSFTLNKGSAHDIKVNDPVIYGKYLVGVVASVTPTQCTVNTILNSKVNVSAYEVRTRDLGYVTSTVLRSSRYGQYELRRVVRRTTLLVYYYNCFNLFPELLGLCPVRVVGVVAAEECLTCEAYGLA